jgi:hypothetical protein
MALRRLLATVMNPFVPGVELDPEVVFGGVPVVTTNVTPYGPGGVFGGMLDGRNVTSP